MVYLNNGDKRPHDENRDNKATGGGERKRERKGNNSISLGLGIASLSLCVISVIIGGIWFEIIAVGLGIASLCVGRKWRGFAISGILVSVLFIAVRIAAIIFIFKAYQDVYQEGIERWEEYQEKTKHREGYGNWDIGQILSDELDNLGR